ncbi:hypothetical protein LTR85_000646 [Meristemomyces frigidus]|nr:hypothetical protein LTR85_000646 [Meristemomyces frigidus]
MPTNRLSKLFSRSEKDKAAEAEAERNGSTPSPPPNYQEVPPDYDGEHALPPPDITAGFSNLKLGDDAGSQPIDVQCIAHLKVLECFYRLRQQIGSTDGLYGIENSVVTAAGLSPNSETANAELLTKLGEKRWAIYVARAVDRFDKWIVSVVPGAQAVRISTLVTEGPQGTLCEPMDDKPLHFDRDNMPPADVLMVWHAYMLNPRAYLEDCLRWGRMRLWHTSFPWQAGVDCINSETFVWEAGDGAEDVFRHMTGLPYDNLAMTGPKVLKCPGCDVDTPAPWTTCSNNVPTGSFPSHKALGVAIDDMLSSGTGYCDKNFLTPCSACGTDITHERLKAAKFCNDVKRLLSPDNVPMGGTLLGLEGIPWKAAGQKDISTMEITETTNKLLYEGLGELILRQKDLGGKGGSQSMEGIRDLVEQALQNRTYIRKVRKSLSQRLLRAERIAIRRMMSRYWENSSPFALDLVGAVVRQGSFIEKMHNIDWLHSPALPSTMKRLVTKYERFVAIMGGSPMRMAVPTLDVDLAWHTHQLNPYSYLQYTIKCTRQFVDHDDKIAETTLNTSFEWTSSQYQKLYKEPYSECTCWYCEAVRESHTSAASRLFNTQSNKVNDQLHDVEQDPRKSVHISTHNAVRPTGKEATYQFSVDKKVKELDKAYFKACERARKKGKKEPKRNDYYYSDAYGYPVYIPATAALGLALQLSQPEDAEGVEDVAVDAGRVREAQPEVVAAEAWVEGAAEEVEAEVAVVEGAAEAVVAAVVDAR